MLPSSPIYRSVLPTPHKRAFRIDIADIDGVVRASNVRPLTGDVTASMSARVTRSARFRLPAEYYPPTSDDPLSPEFAVARIQAGVQYGDGSLEMFPVFTGRINTAVQNPDGTVDFTCYDLADDVIAYRFEQPRSTTQATTLAEMRGLILEALPQAEFGTDTVTDTPTPALTWDEDRGQALDDLAQSVGGRWYTLGNGEFVVRADPQVILISDHASPPIASRAGWDRIRAVRDGRVCTYDRAQGDVLVRPGPRMAQAAKIMVDCLQGRLGK